MSTNLNLNLNLNNNHNEMPISIPSLTSQSSHPITKDQFDVLKCEFCDDHIKRRFIEMKDTFFKIFKNYIKFIKLIKNKDEIILKKIIEDTGNAQKEFINNRALLEKLIAFRIDNINIEYKKPILISGLDENEKKEFFEELNKRKEVLKKFRRNIIELEGVSDNLQKVMEEISLSSCLVIN